LDGVVIPVPKYFLPGHAKIEGRIQRQLENPCFDQNAFGLFIERLDKFQSAAHSARIGAKDDLVGTSIPDNRPNTFRLELRL